MRISDLEVRHGRAQVNGVEYHYVEKGEGPLALLLHGFPENWWGWRYQIDALAAAGLRVVAPDLRGFNESGKEGPYDLDTYCADVTALIRALGAERAHLVGHGFGGAVAWQVAAMSPAYVDRLAVINAPHPARLAEALRSRPLQLGKSAWMLFFQLPFLPEWLLARDRAALVRPLYGLQVNDLTNFSPEELEPILEGVRKDGAPKGMVGRYRAAVAGAIKRRFRKPHLPEIDCDALMIWGKRDRVLGFADVVPGTERFAPGLKVVELEHAGHFACAEAPAAVNAALVEFLRAPRVEAKEQARAAAHATAFRVVLTGVAEDSKIPVIKELRGLTGMELRAAKDLIDGVPSTLFDRSPRAEALRVKELLTAAGAVVELQPAAWSTPPVA